MWYSESEGGNMEKISLTEPQVNDFSQASEAPATFSMKKYVPLFIVMIIAGSLTGFMIAKNRAANLTSLQEGNAALGGSSGDALKVGMKFGSGDESTFRDKAEGIVQSGGIDGEGSHHLVRPGGSAQNVYLTSSVLDLDMFVGHNVRVWGETVGAKKAGWLMDAGKVEILELNAQLPE